MVTGTEALALGLVSHVSESPLDHAQALAEEIATRSPDAVAAAKFLLQEAWHGSERRALAAERRWQRRVIGRGNQRIAVRRNLEKSAQPFLPRRLGN